MLRHVMSKISSLRSTETLSTLDNKVAKPKPLSPPCYMQGSSRLGARIAHCSDSSDYADPRTLFPAITPSRKAASVLGIRACAGSTLCVASVNKSEHDGKIQEVTSIPASKEVEKGKETDKSNPLKQLNESKLKELRLKLSQTRIDNTTEEDACSVGSADSFYERSFEAMESLVETEFRDSAVFSDQEDAFSDDMEVRIPPPKEFDTEPEIEMRLSEEPKPAACIESHKFKGESVDNSSVENKKVYSKLDISKPRKENKLCIVKPLMSISNVTPRSKKLIQISKVSLNSIPDLEIKYSEKYIKGDGEEAICSQCSPKPFPNRRHSCKSVDSSSFFTSCHKCKPSQTDVMSKSCDFTLSSNCNNCIHCASSSDVVCNRCCSQCSIASSASTVIEVTPSSRGWVKHVVNRLQSF